MPEVEAVSLDRLRSGERGIILEYKKEEGLHFRLKELGLVAGTLVLVKRFAPLGDPMEILVRGYSLSLRKHDASKIIVKRIIS